MRRPLSRWECTLPEILQGTRATGSPRWPLSDLERHGAHLASLSMAQGSVVQIARDMCSSAELGRKGSVVLPGRVNAPPPRQKTSQVKSLAMREQIDVCHDRVEHHAGANRRQAYERGHCLRWSAGIVRPGRQGITWR